MRMSYVKEPEAWKRQSRYKAILHFADGGVERLAHLATIRRGAIHGSMRWIVSWNPRFEMHGEAEGFHRKTYREARAELEACLFVHIVGYRVGLDVLAVELGR